MNFHQLEYILAVDTLKHFSSAAVKCNVTQPTLSMMIQKLEEELEVKIFDWFKQSLQTTEMGKTVVDQARMIFGEAGNLKKLVAQQKGAISGDLRIAIIPALAPYLLLLFLNQSC